MSALSKLTCLDATTTTCSKQDVVHRRNPNPRVGMFDRRKAWSALGYSARRFDPSSQQHPTSGARPYTTNLVSSTEHCHCLSPCAEHRHHIALKAAAPRTQYTPPPITHHPIITHASLTLEQRKRVRVRRRKQAGAPYGWKPKNSHPTSSPSTTPTHTTKPRHQPHHPVSHLPSRPRKTTGMIGRKGMLS
jgi:hypothetical protein